jgi:hypothetical protein
MTGGNMLSIDRLIEEHDTMDDMANELMELVRSSEPKANEAFSLLRRLSACLDEHLAGEAGFLYSDHLRSSSARLEEEVLAFEKTFEDLKLEWSTYLHEWMPDNIELDWRNFDHATQWVMGRLRARITQENDILYPLALHYGRIRLRDPSSEPKPDFNATAAYI